MRDLATLAQEQGLPLSEAFWQCFTAWMVLGVPALIAFLAVFWLMVAKQLPGAMR